VEGGGQFTAKVQLASRKNGHRHGVVRKRKRELGNGTTKSSDVPVAVSG